jgi:phosphopantothenate synthetase
MKLKMILAAAAATASMWAVPANSQDAPEHIVSLYRAAPGQQVALLKWMAAQDRASAAAGVAASQIYVHLSGDSWDYLVINPVTTKAQDDAIEAAARQMGLVSGPRASIQFRTMIASHTDTTAIGPTTSARILANLGEK